MTGARRHITPVPRRALAAMLVLGLFAVVAVVAPQPALACDCPEPPPPEEERERADAVFVGEVVSVTGPGPDLAPPDRELLAEIAVDQVYAGEVHERVEVRTSADQGLCGYGFEPGRDELVYATVDDDGTLTTNLCDRTTPLDRAEEDLAALGEGEAPLDGAAPGVAAGAAEDGSSGPLVVAGAAVAVLLLSLGLWLVRRRRTV